MSAHPMTILIAEDDPDDRLLLRDALHQASHKDIHCVFVNDGEELLDYLKCCEPGEDKPRPFPGIIILDLNMPRKDGRETLSEIKSTPRLRNIPIIVLTTSRSEADLRTAYSLGVNSFIRKPSRYGDLVNLIRTLCLYWFEIVRLPASERIDP